MNNRTFTPEDLNYLFTNNRAGYTIGLNEFRFIVGVTKETNPEPIIYEHIDEINFEYLADLQNSLVNLGVLFGTSNSLGWWTDERTGLIHFDIVQGYNNEGEAAKKCEELSELAYYDTKKQESVYL